MRDKRYTAWWPCAILFAELLVFFRRVLFLPGQYVIPWDLQYYHYNMAEFLAASLREGHMPLWDPFTYCGFPFFANIQSQVFYPPALVTALVSNWMGSRHLMHLLEICVVLHVFLAGAVTYWLIRTLGCGWRAALMGGTALQLGCYFVSQTQHVGGIEGSAWLTLAALAVIKLAERATARWIAVLAISVAASVLAGYPSGAGSVLIGSAFLAISLLVCRRAGWRLVGSYAAGALGGALLAAIQLIPTLQVTSLSVSKYRGDWRGYGSGVRLEALASLVWPNYYHILDLNGYKLPYNFTFLYLYCGVAVLGLAAAALVWRRHRLAVSFGVFTLLSALFMLGDSTPLGNLVIPYFHAATHDSIYPEFVMAAFALGTAVLAGMGAELLCRRPWLCAGLLVFTIADLTYVGSGRPMNTRALTEEPGITPAHFDGSVELISGVRRCIDSSNPAKRVDTYGDSMGWAMMASTIRIPTPTGNDPFAFQRYMNVRRLFSGGERWGRYYEVSELDSPVLDLLNVGCLISRTPLPANRKWKLRAELPGHVLYENGSVLPRFFVVHRVVGAGNLEGAIAAMRAPDFDPAREAVVEGRGSRDYGKLGGGPVQVVRYMPEQVTLDVDAGGGGFLVSSESNYPGWLAWIDGRPAGIVQTNGAFRGLDLPKGRHRVEFRFDPPALWWGAGVSLLAMVATGVAVSRV